MQSGSNAQPSTALRAHLGPPPYNTPFHGGSGGFFNERVCPTNSFVTRIQFGFTVDADDDPLFIDYVQLNCRRFRDGTLTSVDCMETGDGCWEFHIKGGVENLKLRALRSECPIGEAGNGVLGRAGRFAYAIGLVCRPKPRSPIKPFRPGIPKKVFQ